MSDNYNNWDPNKNRNYNNMNNHFNQMNINANSFVPGGNRPNFQQRGYNPNYQQQSYQQQGYQQQQYQHPGYQQQQYQQQGYQQYQQQQYQQQQYHQQQYQNQGYSNQQQNLQQTPVYQQQATKQTPPKVETQKVEEDLQDDWDDNLNETPKVATPKIAPTKVPTPKPEPKVEKPKIDPVNSTEPEEKEKTQKPKTTLAKKTFKNDAIPANLKGSKKDHLNVVFIGHVDAGKSTIGGQIMKLTNMVDARTLEKFEREAKEKNRESWYLSWALDTNLEERDKGKTVECGHASFETENKHFTILDAPGHKSFVPNMITGASQADVAVLVISARKGEFEAGFDSGGQTKEHAMLAKTAGVQKLIVGINKMDEQTVKWSVDRYKEIKNKLIPFLGKKCGFRKDDLHFLPISGQTGINILESRVDLHPWYKGTSLIKYLDELPKISRNTGTSDIVRMPVVDKYRDMGLIVMGKLESGQLIKGQTYTIMPNKTMIKVQQILSDDKEVDHAKAGENVKVKIDGVEEDEISSGFVICSNDNLCHYSNTFDVKLRVMELNKPILAAGFMSVAHVHTVTETITVTNIICRINPKTGEKTKIAKGQPRFLKNGDLAIVRMKTTSGNICLENYKDFDKMGRLTLRDEGKTIAMGTIVKVV